MSDNPFEAGIEALRGGKKREARRLFRDAVRDDPDNAAGWWYLAGVIDDPRQKSDCLRQVLRLQPDHAEARKLLVATERQVARPTPPRGSVRPVFEAQESAGRMVVSQDAAQPPNDEAHEADADAGKDVSVMIATVVVALLAIVAAVVLIGNGVATESFGIRMPGQAPTAQPLEVGPPACAVSGGASATLVFINNTDVPVEILQGQEGAEVYLLTIAPGAQNEVLTQGDVTTRYAVRTETAGFAEGGAVISVPAGHSCRVPIE